MAKFEKGNSGNPRGKPKGAKNKIGGELRDFLSEVLVENKQKFKDTLTKLEKVEFIKLYLETLQYTLPKLKQIDHREVPDLEAFLLMTPQERMEKIQELKKLNKNE